MSISKLLNRINSYFIRKKFKSIDKSVVFQKIHLLVNPRFITVGKGTSFQRGLYLTAWDRYGSQTFEPEIRIGDNCAIGAYNHITCIHKIIIGDGLLTGKWVTISDNSHGDTDLESLKVPPSKRELTSKGPVIIGNNVWIGEKATILAGVTIGDCAVIGANTIVSKNVPPYSVLVGSSSRIIKQVKEYDN